MTLFLLFIATFLFTHDPIDVVIPSCKKDLVTLDHSIRGIRKNGKGVRRVIVVSSEKLTKKAEWFDERSYPFSMEDIAFHLNGCDRDKANAYLQSEDSRVGWYYQQLLKLYAPLVIPGISSNILLLDSDTIFLNPVSFLNDKGGGLYNIGSEHNSAYFAHLDRLTDGHVRKLHSSYSGITHHMLIQKSVLQELFREVEAIHKIPFWQAFCQMVNPDDIFAGASEYEIYFNYVLSRSDIPQIRRLKWKNVSNLSRLKKYQELHVDYVSCHAYTRKN